MSWSDKEEFQVDFNNILEIYDFLNDRILHVKNVVPEIHDIAILSSKEMDNLKIEDVVVLMDKWTHLLGVELNFKEFKEIDEMKFNLPAIYEWEELNEEHDPLRLNYSLSYFARDNPQVAIVELILFMMNIYVENNDDIYFTEEYYQDESGLLRPYLTFISIYLGFGQLLLNRTYLIGVNEKNPNDIIYKFYLPLKFEFSILMYYLVEENNNIENKEVPKNVKIALNEVTNYLNKEVIF